MDWKFRIGIISGKLGDVDGVSLEVEKWTKILAEQGHELFTIAGKYAGDVEHVPEERRIVDTALQFGGKKQLDYEKLVFPHMHKRAPHITADRRREIIESLESDGNQVANQLFETIQSNDIDVIIGENTNAMPMTLLGGMGVYKLATERRMATIFHHHDFWWERSRFSHNHIESLLSRIMPPSDPGLEHVVISTYSAHILRSLKRVHPVVIPNCEDFDHPIGKDDYNSDFRRDLGFSEDDILIVQPTRIVRRKRIEDSVSLVGKFAERYPELGKRIRFVISLYQGDEPDENYVSEIKRRAEECGVDVRLIAERVAAGRRQSDDGKKMYTNRDVLANADLVTYLPLWEGFGNAFLEAVAARVPIVVGTYLVYKTDIKILGFDAVEVLDRYDKSGHIVIEERVLDQMHTVLTNRDVRERMIEQNIEIGRKYLGFKTLREKLGHLFTEYGDEIRASRKRIAKSKVTYSV